MEIVEAENVERVQMPDLLRRKKRSECLVLAENVESATPNAEEKTTKGKQIAIFEPSVAEANKAKVPSVKKNQTFKRTKKQKRIQESAIELIDEEDLLETPVQVVREGKEWALVASPNKPPTTT